LLALLALLAVFLLGTGGYYFLEDDVGLGAAAYMTIITLSTVGFGEQWNLSPASKAWTGLIIVIGILVVTLAFASLQAMIVGGEFRTVLGRRKLKDRIQKLSGHYIICGYGRMGKLICRDLIAIRKKIVVVECDERRTPEVEEAGLDYVLGNAFEEVILCEAGIERAAGLVTVLRSDADNVFVTLTAGHAPRPYDHRTGRKHGVRAETDPCRSQPSHLPAEHRGESDREPAGPAGDRPVGGYHDGRSGMGNRRGTYLARVETGRPLPPRAGPA